MSGLNDLRELAIHSLLNPGATVAVIDRLIAAEQRVAELEHNAAYREKRLQARLNACKSVKAIWKERAWTAEEELARRDAAAGEPVVIMHVDWHSADEYEFEIQQRMPDGAHKLFTAAQPFALPPEVPPHPSNDPFELGRATGYNQAIADAKSLGAKPVKLPPTDNQLAEVIRAWNRAEYPGPAAYDAMRKALGFTVEGDSDE